MEERGKKKINKKQKNLGDKILLKEKKNGFLTSYIRTTKPEASFASNIPCCYCYDVSKGRPRTSLSVDSHSPIPSSPICISSSSFLIAKPKPVAFSQRNPRLFKKYPRLSCESPRKSHHFAEKIPI